MLLRALGGHKGRDQLDFNNRVNFLHRFTQGSSVLAIKILWVPEDKSWWRLGDEIKVVQGMPLKFSGTLPGSPVPFTCLGTCVHFHCRNCLFNSILTLYFVPTPEKTSRLSEVLHWSMCVKWFLSEVLLNNCYHCPVTKVIAKFVHELRDTGPAIQQEEDFPDLLPYLSLIFVHCIWCLCLDFSQNVHQGLTQLGWFTYLTWSIFFKDFITRFTSCPL